MMPTQQERCDCTKLSVTIASSTETRQSLEGTRGVSELLQRKAKSICDREPLLPLGEKLASQKAISLQDVTFDSKAMTFQESETVSAITYYLKDLTI